MTKSKRFAGVYVNKMKNGDVSYYFTYRDIHDLGKDGKAKFKRVKVGTKSKGCTEEYTSNKRSETVNALKLGEDSPIKHTKKKIFTFKDGFDDYIVWAKENKKSWERDESIYTLHLNTIKDRSLNSLTKKDFEKIKIEKSKENEKGKKLSPRMIEYILAVARQIINHCIDDELVKNYQNPIRKVHGQGKGLMPKYDNQKLAYLSYEQAKQILEALEQVHTANKKVKTYYPEAYYFSVLMLFTGARFDEVANLTWQNVDFDSCLIHVAPSKNGNARKVQITPPVAKVIDALKEVGESSGQSPLIPNSKGERWDRIPKQWQTTVDKLYPKNKGAGKYRITPHTLRHTHASWLAKNGTDILRIKEQLGHKKLEMTLRYAHLIPDERHNKTKELFDKFHEGN